MYGSYILDHKQVSACLCTTRMILGTTGIIGYMYSVSVSVSLHQASILTYHYPNDCKTPRHDNHTSCQSIVNMTATNYTSHVSQCSVHACMPACMPACMHACMRSTSDQTFTIKSSLLAAIILKTVALLVIRLERWPSPEVIIIVQHTIHCHDVIDVRAI